MDIMKMLEKISCMLIILISFFSADSKEREGIIITRRYLKEAFNGILNSEYYPEGIYYLEEGDSAAAEEKIKEIKYAAKNYKTEDNPYVLRSYMANYTSLPSALNAYGVYRKTLRLEIPDISSKELIECEKPKNILDSLDWSEVKENRCYRFYLFKRLFGFGRTHDESYDQMHKKFMQDEYFRFKEELRIGYDYSLREMPYDSLEKVMKNLNELSKDTFRKLMLADFYYFKTITARFIILVSLNKVNKGEKIYNEKKYTEMLDFFCREDVKRFWNRVLENVDIWRYCKFIDKEIAKKDLITYLEYAKKWEEMKKEKDK